MWNVMVQIGIMVTIIVLARGVIVAFSYFFDWLAEAPEDDRSKLD